MEIRINKNLLLPIAIIFIALLIGGVVLLSDKPNQQPVVSSTQTEQQTNRTANTQQISANARKLELSVPGMFCPGCTASVEGYVSSLPGVAFVQARLTPTKSATIIYNPDQITKEQIIKSQIFDTYGPATIIYDASFDPTTEKLNQSTTSVSPVIQQKTNRVSQLLARKQKEGADTEAIQKQLDKVNTFLSDGNNQEAEKLLDIIITQLERL